MEEYFVYSAFGASWVYKGEKNQMGDFMGKFHCISTSILVFFKFDMFLKALLHLNTYNSWQLMKQISLLLTSPKWKVHFGHINHYQSYKNTNTKQISWICVRDTLEIRHLGWGSIEGGMRKKNTAKAWTLIPISIIYAVSTVPYKVYGVQKEKKIKNSPQNNSQGHYNLKSDTK